MWADHCRNMMSKWSEDKTTWTNKIVDCSRDFIVSHSSSLTCHFPSIITVTYKEVIDYKWKFKSRMLTSFNRLHPPDPNHLSTPNLSSSFFLYWQQKNKLNNETNIYPMTMTLQNEETKSSDKQMCDMILIEWDDLKVLQSRWGGCCQAKQDYETIL